MRVMAIPLAETRGLGLGIPGLEPEHLCAELASLMAKRFGLGFFPVGTENFPSLKPDLWGKGFSFPRMNTWVSVETPYRS